jgi:hypothetical protein
MQKEEMVRASIGMVSFAFSRFRDFVIRALNFNCGQAH